MAHQLPETGYLRLSQIIGQLEVTEEQAAVNRKIYHSAAKKCFGKPLNPRAAIPAIIPVSKSSWWAGVAAGRYPKPVKLGPRTTVWSVESIRALIAETEVA